MFHVNRRNLVHWHQLFHVNHCNAGQLPKLFHVSPSKAGWGGELAGFSGVCFT